MPRGCAEPRRLAAWYPSGLRPARNNVSRGPERTKLASGDIPERWYGGRAGREKARVRGWRGAPRSRRAPDNGEEWSRARP
eukprot:2962687-Rhodomonas_salina.1